MVAFSAIPALEMGIRGVGKLYQFAYKRKDPDIYDPMSRYLIGVVLLTPCALDVFPGARLCGVIGFNIYSYNRGDQDQALLTAKLICALDMKIVGLASVVFKGLVFAKQHIGKIILFSMTAYFLFARIDVSKTTAMFSRVWRKE